MCLFCSYSHIGCMYLFITHTVSEAQHIIFISFAVRSVVPFRRSIGRDVECKSRCMNGGAQEQNALGILTRVR